MEIKIKDDIGNDELIPIDYLLINHKLRLFGSILVLFEKYETKSVPTAAVGVRDGRGVLFYNKTFMESLTYNERVFVLIHEAAHLITETFSREGNKDKLFWNLATDTVINELIFSCFGILPPKDVLMNKTLIEMGFSHNIKEKNFQGKAAEEIYGFMISQIVKAEMKEDGICELTLKSGKKFRFMLYGGIHDSGDMDPLMKEKIGGVLKEYSEAGTASGDFLKKLSASMVKHFPFRDILKKQFDKKNFDFSRKNRRLKAKNTFFPRRKNEVFKVYAAVDVSGSCYEFTEDFLGYIMALPEFEEVVFFDSNIVKTIVKGEKLPPAMKGYGGTDLNPVINRWKQIEKQSRGFRMNFVCLTDGYIMELKGITNTQPLVLTCGLEIPGCKNIKIK
jgi:predicted metal-dependent peptidase